MTLTLIPPLADESDTDWDEHFDGHYGIVAATQMLRANEVTVLEFLALCEEAAELADEEEASHHLVKA